MAVSITRHKIKDNKYIEYTVVIHQKGYEVHALTKRYKQFEALDAALKVENKYVDGGCTHQAIWHIPFRSGGGYVNMWILYVCSIVFNRSNYFVIINRH